MPNQYSIDPAKDAEIFAAWESAGGWAAASRALGIAKSTIQDSVKRHKQRIADAGAPNVPVAAPLPADDVPTAELIDMMCRRFEKRQANAEAQRWRRFQVPHKGPYALAFMGDPHVDDNGCNWPLLRRHCQMLAEAEGVYAVNIGDTTNNWAGRLERLWAHQDTSGATARKLAHWLLNESGVPWFLWLHGNHDSWAGPVGTPWFEAVKPHYVHMAEWGAKVTLVSPNGHELRLWAAHNFKGSSIWNNMHGLERAAQMADWAHLYVAGHHHDFGIREGENAERRYIYNLVRARGYKFIDHHADVHGFPSYEHGATVLAVVDPDAGKANAVKAFSDLEHGLEYLAWKRSRRAA